ncbi:unannotated protein [freshwater metagenome]|uniref:Unannotated protein n=1 Tax=freshwater metagenome TaxID=449393 RepID=A0A6J6E9D7_9ZZZZ
MTGVTAAKLKPDQARLQIELIVNHNDALGWNLVK